eukprot:UN10519
MKYIAALLLLGAISSTDARVPNALAQIESRNTNFLAAESESGSDDDESTLVQLDKPCEYLDETNEELTTKLICSPEPLTQDT